MYLKSKFLNEEALSKIEQLISEMTFDEKVGQLHQISLSSVGAFEIDEETLKQMCENGQLTKQEYEENLSKSRLRKIGEDGVRLGKIGSYLGIADPKQIDHFQKIAVEQSRLHIPLLIGCDIVHGFNTVFPIPLAESCTFDDEMFEKSASVAANEARAAGINWFFAPMLDVARDARWGRIAESMGQDTYLAKNYAKAKVVGFQGDDLSNESKVAACAKHFVAYGACESGRDYNTVDLSYEKLHDVYMPPFESAVNAGVASIMTAFNDINGVPMTANKELLKDYLREKLKFDGVIVTDASSMKQLVDHGYCEDGKTAAEYSMHSTVDIDMVSNLYRDCLKELVDENKVSICEINDAVRRILKLKFALGLFENPYSNMDRLKEVSCADEHIEFEKQVALHSTVLLKNDGILPIKKEKYSKITLIGALGADIQQNYGCWAWYGKDELAVSLKSALEKDGVDYCRCYGVYDIDEAQMASALDDSELIIAVMGEHKDMNGEAHSYADITLSEPQKRAFEMLVQSKKPFVCVLYNGRPLCIPEMNEHANAIVEGWALGTKMGDALSDILFGRFNPCGKLTVNFPNKSGECPTYYNHMSTGRPAKNDNAPWTSKFDDSHVLPLYSFGHGLSYTEFEYSDLTVSTGESSADITVKVKNSGCCDGFEIVQLYVHDCFASRVRPVKELKGYKKVFIESGHQKVVSFKLDYDELAFHNSKLEKIVEKGKFEVFVGGSSINNIQSEFELK